MLTPPIIYLDSSDYSTLSDPRQSSLSLGKLKTELLAIAASGDAIFAYSGIHLSEMAPLTASSASAAEARAELLSKLCGFNAFVSLDHLLRWELGGAIGVERDHSKPLLSATGDWFPTMGGQLPSISWAKHWTDLRMMLVQHFKEQPLSRAQRREWERLEPKLFLNGKPSPRARELLAKLGMDAKSHDDFLGKYPMRPEDAKTLYKYASGSGRTTHAEAEDALLNSLRDPRWMMQWFEKNHSDLGSLGDMLRQPARKVISEMRSIATSCFEFKERWGDAGVPAMAKALGPASQGELLLSIANKLARHLFPSENFPAITDVKALAGACPGLSVAARCMHSVFCDATRASPRPLTDSDFVDIAHAMYSPHVSLFRTDRYMASQVKKHLGGSTVVVSKLDSLLVELRKM